MKLILDKCDVVYNELPIKQTNAMFDDDCVIYEDLPVKMTYEEQERLKNLKFTKPTLDQAADDYKYGCKEAFNYLYNHYKKKIQYVASKYNNEDIVQELAIVLHHCTQKYEAGGSSCFNTLFWTSAQNHLKMILVKQNSKKRKNEFGEISLNVSASNDVDAALENVIEDTSMNNEFDNILFGLILKQKILPYLEYSDKLVVMMIVEGYSIKEIADKLQVNTANIYIKLKRIREQRGLSELLKQLHYSRKAIRNN